jgi:hypothetical protein
MNHHNFFICTFHTYIAAWCCGTSTSKRIPWRRETPGFTPTALSAQRTAEKKPHLHWSGSTPVPGPETPAFLSKKRRRPNEMRLRSGCQHGENPPPPRAEQQPWEHPRSQIAMTATASWPPRGRGAKRIGKTRHHQLYGNGQSEHQIELFRGCGGSAKPL